MAVASLGIYSVAYKIPILSQGFWWLLLLAILISSICRINSERFKQQIAQLTVYQATFVKSLMLLITLPVMLGVFANAANLTGIW